MKPTLTIILSLVWVAGMGQTADLKKLHEQYVEYCNEIVTDTIEEYGEVEATKEVPIYDGCEQIVGYRSIPAKDTVWKGYKCKEWKTVHTIYRGIAIDSLSSWSTDLTGEYILSVEGGVIKRKIWPGSCKVSRKQVCNVKREKPSKDGFYEWMWKYLSN